MASTTTIINTSSIQLNDLGPTPWDFDVGDPDIPSDFLADTFDVPDDGPYDDGDGNHKRTAMIASIILGLGFVALMGALLFVWFRRRQRTRYFRDGQEVTKEGMALQSVESFAVAKDGSAVDLRGGAASVNGDGSSILKSDGGDKLEAPPPTYDEVVKAPAPANQRVSDGVVVRRGWEVGEDKDVVPDGRRLTSESGWEQAERMEGGDAEWPRVGTREFI